ncbi:deoxyuridine 5'-triphosphate nucleotidohydrolase [Clostridium aminobutyricum]|uniref:dUTP diphosphatase n=1 Tax=Clostridium aminobutyricum TaxID=33953 RepID=A0A939IHU1_CLOAM|nr:deoxyuridine 5'-triphosphate nucleotidohydrolase [Clostridium aminobutyricum]MBN7772391.1 deoxyuridine 5'-triphosphate nucleotidohydrolase [Clostridium aminobutyricum]
MQKIARFYKVSFTQFKKDWKETFGDHPEIEDVYESIRMPKRATSGSAGYDFYAPMSFHLEAGESIKIPTGIRVEISKGWVLMCFPRSGLGFKYRMQLDNTVGIIDSDYFHAENEGHIMIKITNDSTEGKTLTLEQGKGFSQGIFVAFGITEDDDSTEIRKGGFGSTN